MKVDLTAHPSKRIPTAFKSLVRAADRVVELDSPEDVPLKNIAGTIARAELRRNQLYTCRVEGEKILFVLRDKS